MEMIIPTQDTCFLLSPTPLRFTEEDKMTKQKVQGLACFQAKDISNVGNNALLQVGGKLAKKFARKLRTFVANFTSVTLNDAKIL